MAGSRNFDPIRRLGSALLLSVALAGPALAQTATPDTTTQMVAPGAATQTVRPEADKPPREAATPPSCANCRGGEAALPTSSDTIIMTDDGKTIVPRTVIRQQSDFQLNQTLRNVPGINRR